MVTEAWIATARQNAANVVGAGKAVMKNYNGTLAERTRDGTEKPKEGVKEVVMLQCCSAVGDNFMLTADIVRNDGRKPGLDPWKRMENSSSEGRFVFDVVPLVERQ